MTDTTPQMAARYRALLLRRSGEERLRMGCSMHETARTLVLASVRARDAGASPAALRRALFLRFYGADFDREALRVIGDAVGRWAERPEITPAE